jgi:putative flippase GtrA
MDVDLSTDLRALFPLVAALISGHSDLAIGSRLARGAHVVRGRKRELISRAYNRLLHVVLGARFSDAQCGFKAIRADVAERLLPEVRDDRWFFDTELLVLAQRHGLRVHEVAVDWVEDADSRVEIVRTAWQDLCGVARLGLQTQLTRFVIIGLLSTIAYGAVYLGLRAGLAPATANAVALALTAVANTHANRRFTFGLTGRAQLLRQHAAGALVYGLTLGLTTAALAALREPAPHPSRLLEIAVVALASGFATVSRCLALRTWVFATGASAKPLLKLSSSSQPSRR